jgi:hypothetical protein
MFGVFAWPWGQDISVTKLILSPKKMLATLWPVALGVGIAGTIGTASTRGFCLPVPAIPARDLLEVFLWLSARLSRGCQMSSKFIVARWRRIPRLGDKVSSAKSRWIALSCDIERALRHGPVFGVLLLLLAGLLVALLALP